MALWGKFGLTFLILAVIVAMAGKYESARSKYQRECQSEVSHILAANPTKDQHCSDECKDAKEYMPWGYILISWPDGITVWALLLTLGAIVYQAIETGNAARGAERAADATLAQTQLMRDKERARLIVEPSGLEVITDPESKPGWHLKATIKVQNIGASRAFGTKAMVSLWVQDSSASITHPEFRFPWNSPRAFDISIEPGDYVVDLDSRVPVDPESPELTVSQLMEGLFGSGDADSSIPPKKAVYLQGFVEYETLGVIFHRNYGWYWTPMDADMGGTLMGGTSVEGRWYEDRNQKNDERPNPN